MRIGAAAAAFSLAAATLMPSPSWAGADAHGVAPWTEAVVIVDDLDASASWLVEDGNWREAGRGEVSRTELDYWRLPAAASGSFLRICAAGSATGCIRYIDLDGVAQRPIRLAARPWDTGGIFSIMLRSEDTQALFDAAIARGWWAESEPYRFNFAGSALVNVVVRGPHGVNYALYQRTSPPFDAFPIGRLSQAFNTMRMVRNQPESLAFYRDRLGFKVLFDAPYTDPEPISNNFSVPANMATTLVRRAAVAQPVLPEESGRVEVMQFEGFTGRDLSALAAPPNFGIISVRYPVADLPRYKRELAQQGVEPVYEAAGVDIGGIGTVDLFAVRDPDGNLTEFYHAR